MIVNCTNCHFMSVMVISNTKILSSSDIIALCAVFVAIIALGVGFWQSYLAWKHNKLSVKPHLDFTFTCRWGAPVSYILKNHGLGPAIIHKLTVFWNNTEYPLNCTDDIDRLLDDFLGPKLRPIAETEYSITLGNTAILGVGTETPIIMFKTCQDQRLFDYLKNNKILIKVEYTCAYGCKYERKSE